MGDAQDRQLVRGDSTVRTDEGGANCRSVQQSSVSAGTTGPVTFEVPRGAASWPPEQEDGVHRYVRVLRKHKRMTDEAWDRTVHAACDDLERGDARGARKRGRMLWRLLAQRTHLGVTLWALDSLLRWSER